MTAASSGSLVDTRLADLPPRRLWSGILLAPAAWVLEGLFGWAVGARICTSLSIASVRLIIGGFSVLMLAAAAAGLWIAVGSWREATGDAQIPSDRVEFMALAGVFVSTSFVIAVFWSGLSAAVLNVCGRMR